MSEPTGTLTAHGRTWPLYNRRAYMVEVSGYLNIDDEQQAEALAAELRSVLARYGVTVSVSPVGVNFLSPEDQAEKDRLDAEWTAGTRRAA